MNPMRSYGNLIVSCQALIRSFPSNLSAKASRLEVLRLQAPGDRNTQILLVDQSYFAVLYHTGEPVTWPLQ